MKPHRSSVDPRSAFSLTEMVVVIGIIVLLLAATIPGLSSLWAERKHSEIVTTLSGALANARAKALNGRDSGLFFCVVDNIQKAFPIERYDEVTTPPNASVQDVASRFRIAEGAALTFPEPLRVVPRNVLDDPAAPGALSWEVWDDTELLNSNYRSESISEPQHHRNFFTLVFASDGRQLIGVDVWVYDFDPIPPTDLDQLGDRTGLTVGDPGTVDTIGPGGMQSTNFVNALTNLIVDDGNTNALNFISVDGLLVYDEKEFTDPIYPDAIAKRAYLTAEAQPLYISRNTGKVIVGPSSEN